MTLLADAREFLGFIVLFERAICLWHSYCPVLSLTLFIIDLCLIPYFRIFILLLCCLILLSMSNLHHPAPKLPPFLVLILYFHCLAPTVKK